MVTMRHRVLGAVLASSVVLVGAWQLDEDDRRTQTHAADEVRHVTDANGATIYRSSTEDKWRTIGADGTTYERDCLPEQVLYPIHEYPLGVWHYICWDVASITAKL